MADQFNALELLLDDNALGDETKRKAMGAQFRKQNAMGVIGQLMGVQPTQMAGQNIQQGAQNSLKMALAQRQAASEAASAAAQRKTEGERFQLNYDQRERGIDATRTNQAAAQANAAAGLDLRKAAADRAAEAATAAAEAKKVATDIKVRGEQDKYTSQLSSANDTLKQIEDAYNHPGRKAATGGSWGAGYIPATDARDYRIKIAQLAGGAFLTAFQSLRGGGQITEVEGKKATDAITTLGDLTASESAHEQALKDFYDIVARAKQRAEGHIKELNVPQSAIDTTVPGGNQIPGTAGAAPGGAPQAPVGTQGAPIAIYDANGRRTQ